MRLLVVEDEEHTRAELMYLLKKVDSDLTLFEASNAPEALASAEAEDIEAAFLNINLPGQSGLALAADLLKLDEPPLIVFSTAATEHALEAFDVSALDYIVKPYREARLAETLARLRKARQQPEANSEQEALRTYLTRRPRAPLGGAPWGRGTTA